MYLYIQIINFNCVNERKYRMSIQFFVTQIIDYVILNCLVSNLISNTIIIIQKWIKLHLLFSE